MIKKKLYYVIIETSLAIVLIAALVSCLGGNKTETPNSNTTSHNISESVGNKDLTTTDSKTTINVGDTAKPDYETTKPSEDTTYKKGDLTAEGYVYYPDFDIEDPKKLDDFIKEYSPHEKIHIVRFVDGEWEGLVSRENDVVQVVKKNDEEQMVTLYFDNGETIVTLEKYDDNGNVVYSSRESSGSDISTESHYSDNVETRTVKEKSTGVTKTLKIKTITINGTTYQRLIYIDTGKGMVQSFEYADYANKIISAMTVSEREKTYTWNMDGKGNDVENIVSLTIGGNTIPRQNVNLMEYTTPPGHFNNY